MKIFINSKKLNICDENNKYWEDVLDYSYKIKNESPLNYVDIDLLTILKFKGVYQCLWIFRFVEDFSIFRLIATEMAELLIIQYSNKINNLSILKSSIYAAREFAYGKIGHSDLGDLYVTNYMTIKNSYANKYSFNELFELNILGILVPDSNSEIPAKLFQLQSGFNNSSFEKKVNEILIKYLN